MPKATTRTGEYGSARGRISASSNVATPRLRRRARDLFDDSVERIPLRQDAQRMRSRLAVAVRRSFADHDEPGRGIDYGELAHHSGGRRQRRAAVEDDDIGRSPTLHQRPRVAERLDVERLSREQELCDAPESRVGRS